MTSPLRRSNPSQSQLTNCCVNKYGGLNQAKKKKLQVIFFYYQ